jgi:SAM-dependent methyltransferase
MFLNRAFAPYVDQIESRIAGHLDTDMSRQKAGRPLISLNPEEFNILIHALRTDCLRATSGPVDVLVSAGAGGAWYFDWVAENLRGVRRHIGIERYSPRPDLLPKGCEWLQESVDEMVGVPDGCADALFSGQNLEHLWPEQVVGFMKEAHRVLRPDGLLILDSPNASVTAPLGYHHGEHTIEFTHTQARDLLTAAGFAITELRGIWAVHDRKGKLQPLIPVDSDLNAIADRVALGAYRPADAFLWWIEARRTKSLNEKSLRKVVWTAFHDNWQERISRGMPGAKGWSGFNWSVDDHRGGEAFFGGTHPLPPGRYLFEARIIDEKGKLVTDAKLVYYHPKNDIEVRKLRSGDGFLRWAIRVPDVRFGMRWRVIVPKPCKSLSIEGLVRLGERKKPRFNMIYEYR